ncbi:uncharacterized protein MONBRDRAFT_29669 [Monosiga brevicollis MX1]|uniref:J domain-containing protein n=1 Tax=Monosiga brevicollis TaxID=81824 RepID=A9VBS8_MONBE|nr:uncharacterized protein MONBRDRAFT_29669 [Monosiga brevicollis MX1]EDQ84985.1 predicted protein [Monosiga brevicollis MX1]|eukprot:XP_001750155.1 hypothetical protein [Monosiga brevicollis MX1]
MSSADKKGRRAPKRAKKQAVEDDEPDLDQERRQERLRAALRVGLVGKRQVEATNTAIQEALGSSGGLSACSGVDVVRPRTNKQRFLFAFPGYLPLDLANDKLGEVYNLDTNMPSMSLHTAQGHVRLEGVLAYPKRNILTLEQHNNLIKCNNQFDCVVLFPEIHLDPELQDDPHSLYPLASYRGSIVSPVRVCAPKLSGLELQELHGTQGTLVGTASTAESLPASQESEGDSQLEAHEDEDGDGDGDSLSGSQRRSSRRRSRVNYAEGNAEDDVQIEEEDGNAQEDDTSATPQSSTRRTPVRRSTAPLRPSRAPVQAEDSEAEDDATVVVEDDEGDDGDDPNDADFDPGSAGKSKGRAASSKTTTPARRARFSQAKARRSAHPDEVEPADEIALNSGRSAPPLRVVVAPTRPRSTSTRNTKGRGPAAAPGVHIQLSDSEDEDTPTPRGAGTAKRSISQAPHAADDSEADSDVELAEEQRSPFRRRHHAVQQSPSVRGSLCLLRIMAAPGEDDGLKLKAFLAHVNQVAADDSQWTSERQIERLLRPGKKYRNLNPYEVLQVPWDCEDSVIKKQYRKLSILLHPDKNRGNPEQAQEAFEEVNKAKQMLDDPEKMGWVNMILEEAQQSFPYLSHSCDLTRHHQLTQRRKEAKKKGEKLPEDLSQEQYNESFRRHTMKMFAEKQKELEDQVKFDQEQKRRLAEEKEALKEARKAKAEYEKAWAAGRDARMDAWAKFEKANKADEKKKKKKEKKIKSHFRPPKHKMEQRD